MVSAIREVEAALGDGLKRPSISELKNKHVARKSLVANDEIRVGDYFTQKNLTCKRRDMVFLQCFGTIILAETRNYDKDDLIDHEESMCYFGYTC